MRIRFHYLLVRSVVIFAGCVTLPLSAQTQQAEAPPQPRINIPSVDDTRYFEGNARIMRPPVAFTNATLIDGTGAAPKQGMTVVVDKGRIRDIFRTGEREPPPGAERLDLTERFVIPGLVNTHFHFDHVWRLSQERTHAELERMLYGGVTAVREMVGDTRRTAELARAALAGDRDSPDIYYAALVAGPAWLARDPRVARAGWQAGNVPWFQKVTPESDLPLLIARASGTLATGIKMYSDIDADLARRITEESHRQGLRVWSHATLFPASPLDVVAAGVDSISHACLFAWQTLPTIPDPDVSDASRPRRNFQADSIDVDSLELDKVFAEMVQRGTVLDATVYWNAFLRKENPTRGCTAEQTAAIARKAHQAGVLLSTGTDFAASADDIYPALFTEIEYLVDQEVLTPAEAITAATLNGARAIGVEDMRGTLEPGKIADLVILGSDPTKDIRALRSVVATVKRGKMYRREDYDARRN